MPHDTVLMVAVCDEGCVLPHPMAPGEHIGTNVRCNAHGRPCMYRLATAAEQGKYERDH